jgi:hypothetical protein
VHLKRVILEKRIWPENLAKSLKILIFLKLLVLEAFCHKGKITFLKSTQKDESFDTQHD